ncbi:helix-turn-helix domain-containing protein [Salegentibacter sp. BLCTC]|uniref:helix-turn-helix domain-containing protein n=1 Tax=Salegentibacter sp. BLCTC TaxID=2697368 RepID=UPI00187B1DBA|nr:helix-turn-helix domain-containing protein [Salegentibacter sp. BLCTC]MBE7639058.1 helix-turn-helix domain-containing protein [Salegentibacter sp. BLCTC]
MKDNELANRLIELRKRKGFSQEFLAEESGISLRTIQRIEKGETQPRGDTLQRIAKGLGVTSEELIDWKLEKNSSYLVLLNTSALSFLFFPILGVLIPLVMWVSKKNRIHNINNISKKILNFEITWCIFLSISIIAYTVANIYRLENSSEISASLLLDPSVLWISVSLLYLFNLMVVLYNSFRLKSGKETIYYLSVPFLK